MYNQFASRYKWTVLFCISFPCLPFFLFSNRFFCLLFFFIFLLFSTKYFRFRWNQFCSQYAHEQVLDLHILASVRKQTEDEVLKWARRDTFADGLIHRKPQDAAQVSII